MTHCAFTPQHPLHLYFIYALEDYMPCNIIQNTHQTFLEDPLHAGSVLSYKSQEKKGKGGQKFPPSQNLHIGSETKH